MAPGAELGYITLLTSVQFREQCRYMLIATVTELINSPPNLKNLWYHVDIMQKIDFEGCLFKWLTGSSICIGEPELTTDLFVYFTLTNWFLQGTEMSQFCICFPQFIPNGKLLKC